MTDWQLIRKFVEQGSQAAFAELMGRYMNLVYCTCLRELNEQTLAEDTTQAVFLILVRKAPHLRPNRQETTLAGWLFQTALLTSKSVLRRERRRREHEQETVQMQQSQIVQQSQMGELPEQAQAEMSLNEALLALPKGQRSLLLERFFQQRSLVEIGAERGISEDAARMRVNRALDRLRRFFAARDVALSAAALAVVLGQAIRPAPARCTEPLLWQKLLSSPAVSRSQTIAQGAIHAMNIKQLSLQLGAVTLVASLSLGTAGAVHLIRPVKPRVFQAEKPQPAPPADADIKAALTTITEGVTGRLGLLTNQPLTLTAAKPAGITKEPSYVGVPLYGTLHFGTDADNGFPVALNMAADASHATLYVDADRKGDLTTQAVTLTRYGEESGRIIYNGAIRVAPASSGGTPPALSLAVFILGAKFAKAIHKPADTLYYTLDYGQSGKLTLGGKTYPVLLLNTTATGRYDVTAHAEKDAHGGKVSPPVLLLIDRNGDGAYDSHLESYDASKPFNIGGTTYRIAKITPDGTQLTLKKAAEAVAEVPMPVMVPRSGSVNVNVGQPAPAFTCPVMGGETVKFPDDFGGQPVVGSTTAIRFPGDYHGKIVLVDFWATRNGPSVGEFPGIVTAYQKYHSRGFEVLGINLDAVLPEQEKQFVASLNSRSVTWNQVGYGGANWSWSVARLYGIDADPYSFLVDGTTGKIIAEGNDLRGNSLDGQISKAVSTVKVSRR